MKGAEIWNNAIELRVLRPWKWNYRGLLVLFSGTLAESSFCALASTVIVLGRGNLTRQQREQTQTKGAPACHRTTWNLSSTSRNVELNGWFGKAALVGTTDTELRNRSVKRWRLGARQTHKNCMATISHSRGRRNKGQRTKGPRGDPLRKPPAQGPRAAPVRERIKISGTSLFAASASLPVPVHPASIQASSGVFPSNRAKKDSLEMTTSLQRLARKKRHGKWWICGEYNNIIRVPQSQIHD